MTALLDRLLGKLGERISRNPILEYRITAYHPRAFEPSSNRPMDIYLRFRGGREYRGQVNAI